MLLGDRTAFGDDMQVRSIVHAVTALDQTTKEYGAKQRQVRIAKYHGVAFRGGLPPECQAYE